MAILTQEFVEEQIIKIINQVAARLNLEAIANFDQIPPETFTSNALLNIMATISIELGVDIPKGCYVFHDQQTKKRLPVREAATKFIQNVTNGK